MNDMRDDPYHPMGDAVPRGTLRMWSLRIWLAMTAVLLSFAISPWGTFPRYGLVLACLCAVGAIATPYVLKHFEGKGIYGASIFVVLFVDTATLLLGLGTEIPRDVLETNTGAVIAIDRFLLPLIVCAFSLFPLITAIRGVAESE